MKILLRRTHVNSTIFVAHNFWSLRAIRIETHIGIRRTTNNFVDCKHDMSIMKCFCGSLLAQNRYYEFIIIWSLIINWIQFWWILKKTTKHTIIVSTHEWTSENIGPFDGCFNAFSIRGEKSALHERHDLSRNNLLRKVDLKSVIKSRYI